MEFKTIELKESIFANNDREADRLRACLLYTSPSPRD